MTIQIHKGLISEFSDRFITCRYFFVYGEAFGLRKIQTSFKKTHKFEKKKTKRNLKEELKSKHYKLNESFTAGQRKTHMIIIEINAGFEDVDNRERK